MCFSEIFCQLDFVVMVIFFKDRGVARLAFFGTSGFSSLDIKTDRKKIQSLDLRNEPSFYKNTLNCQMMISTKYTKHIVRIRAHVAF